jgi:CHAD domain-containing protein
MAKRPRVIWNVRLSAAVNARRHLPKLAAAYFDEARTLLDKAEHPAQFHRLRLISKRLRYTLELFRPCYTPALAERIDALKRVQDLLGNINDDVAAARLIAKMPNSVRMRRFLDDRAAQKAAEFRAEWRTRFDAPGRESWWLDYLRGAGTPVRRAGTLQKPRSSE